MNPKPITIADCPACKAKIQGIPYFEPNGDSAGRVDDVDGKLYLTFVLKGLRLNPHDCTPKVTRGRRNGIGEESIDLSSGPDF